MWHRNGIESRDLLPLWKEDGVAIPFKESLEMVLQERWNRNGTESRDLLPLWKQDGEAIPFRESLAMALQERQHRNGCRCGSRMERQSRSESPWRWLCRKGSTATAPNRGICCRCGKMTPGKECRRLPSAGLLVQTQFRMAVRGAAEQHGHHYRADSQADEEVLGDYR